jgi:hypothetical protein
VNTYDSDMQVVVPVDDVLVHREDGDAFLLHVPSGRYFGLNQTGLVVWDALVAGDDPGAALHLRWPRRTPEQCQSDAAALVDALRNASLVSDRSP